LGQSVAGRRSQADQQRRDGTCGAENHSPSPSRNPGSINGIDQEQGTFKTIGGKR
jgi:hypothetical protein